MSDTRKVARAKRDADGNIISEQVAPEVQEIIEQWAYDHRDDLNERLEPLGLGNYNIVNPTYRQIVLVDEDPLSVEEARAKIERFIDQRGGAL